MKNPFYLLLALLLPFACSKDASLDAGGGQAGSITRFAIWQGHLYTLDQNAVLTYSLADPDSPQLVHRLPTDFGLETILVQDGAVFVGSTTALYILDVSSPAVPVLLSKTERGFEFFGGCDPVVVKGDYAFSTIKIIENICGRVGSRSALLIYDVRDPAAPKLVGEQPLTTPNGLGWSGNYLFVCDEGADRLEVFDITDPLATAPLPGAAVPMTDPVDLIVRDSTMIVSTKKDFRIFDISGLPALRQVGQISK